MKPDKESIITKLQLIEKELKGIFINRDSTIELAILALMTKENLILFGPPGTGKSYLAVEISKRIKGGNYFQKLLTKFTREGELFISGQLIEEVENKKEKSKLIKMKNSYENMLPKAHVAFLDEAFKANSAILNSLLTLMNEKIYYVDEGKFEKSNTITVFAASNERPATEDGLDAFYDRFLLRTYVDKLSGNDLLKLLTLKPEKTINTFIEIEDLLCLEDYLADILVPHEILQYICDFLKKHNNNPDSPLNNLHPSDRRVVKSIQLLKASALLRNRERVENEDLVRVLPYIFWDTAPSLTRTINKEQLKILINEFSREVPYMPEALKIRTATREILSEISDSFQALKNDFSPKSLQDFYCKSIDSIADINISLKKLEEIETKFESGSEKEVILSISEELNSAVLKIQEMNNTAAIQYNPNYHK